MIVDHCVLSMKQATIAACRLNSSQPTRVPRIYSDIGTVAQNCRNDGVCCVRVTWKVLMHSKVETHDIERGLWAH